MEDQQDINIGSLVKIISHDMRGPLGNFKNVSTLLKSGSIEIEQVKMFMEQIEIGVDRSLKLLDDLIEWGISVSDIDDKYQQEVDVGEVIKTSCISFEERFKEKDIKLIFTPKQVEKGYVNEHGLKVVLKNLLMNALFFTRPKGNVHINMDEDARQVIVSISDDGLGIPENMKNRIFEMGKDNRRLGTNKEKGTGIGLFICKDILNKNNARIWLDYSRENMGTTFKFLIKKLSLSKDYF